MTYVANVIEKQLHNLDPARVRARQRTQIRLREFVPVQVEGVGVAAVKRTDVAAASLIALGRLKSVVN